MNVVFKPGELGALELALELPLSLENTSRLLQWYDLPINQI